MIQKKQSVRVGFLKSWPVAYNVQPAGEDAPKWIILRMKPVDISPRLVYFRF